MLENQATTALEKTEARKAAEEKVAQLSEQLGIKVHLIAFKEQGTENEIYGYLKEPNRQVKLAVMDKQLVGAFSAASEMLDVILIKEHSDPKIYSESPDCDAYYFGAVQAAHNLIKMSINQVSEKKSS